MRRAPARRAPGEAPNNSDVFDYEQPTTGGSHVLFSVQFVPPTQADALARARREGTRRVAWLLVLTLVAALWLVPAGVVRVGLALVPLGLALRAPLGALLGVPRPFDPSVFSSPLLGVVSAAAGPLAVIGVVLILVGALLWERAPARRLPSLLAAGVLLVGAPYLLGGLGRGIVPPSAGVTIGVWLVWHLTLFALAAGMVTVAAALLRGTAEPSGWRSPLVSVSALIVPAAALFRGSEPDYRPSWRVAVGVAIAVAATIIGVLVWSPRGGWPDWYTLLWLPPLALVTRPADRRAAIVSIALVAGSAAALLAWGADIEGRLQAARRDLAGLGDVSNAPVSDSLRAWGDSLRHQPVPASPSELYALWRSSPFWAGGRPPPVTLGVWRPDGTPRFALELDALDLSSDRLAALVRGLTPADTAMVIPLRRAPGAHQVLLVRSDSTAVLSVALGPRSALVPRARLGRLLDPTPPRAPIN